MNIVISGVSGFIGGDLLKILSSNENFNAIGIGRNINNEIENLYNVELTNSNSVRNFMSKLEAKKIKVDVFVHCASILVDNANNKDINVFNQNNLITENVILMARELQIKTIINLSTIGVYPNRDGEYFENSSVNPSKNFECLYSLSKFCSEELLHFYLSETATKVVNLRLAQVYGKRMRQDRIFKIMENEMKESGKISVWTNGERVSNFVSIDKVLKAIIHFIKNPIDETFNVCGDNLSYKELALKVIEINGYRDIEICLVDKGLPTKVLVNGDKLKKIIMDL
jgi:nucleoside-diphosphate-sugar epimerase